MSISIRIRNRLRRDACKYFARRPFDISLSSPLISFTFDDFPQSAWTNGGRILREHGVAGTFYTALGLMGREMDAGAGFQRDDLAAVVAQGNELGCHTFSHCPSWETAPADFEREILENRSALQKLLPGANFRTMSWPINSPRPQTKRRAARYFEACRGGGQGFNVGMADLNFLNSFFIEQSVGNPSAMKDLIARNRAANGWLIFSTHDVCEKPTRLGCTPELFVEIVRCAVESGAEVVTMGQALNKIGAAKTVAVGDSNVGGTAPATAHALKP